MRRDETRWTHEMRPQAAARAAPPPARTCVGLRAQCGRRGGRTLVRGCVARRTAEVAFDLAGGAFGRGAHVHARPACLEKAPRGSRARVPRQPRRGRRRRARAPTRSRPATGAWRGCSWRRRRDARSGHRAPTRRSGRSERRRRSPSSRSTRVSVASRRSRCSEAVAEGRAVAWKTKSELGRLARRRDRSQFARFATAGIAAELKRHARGGRRGRGGRLVREGAGCSRFPEAR